MTSVCLTSPWLVAASVLAMPLLLQQQEEEEEERELLWRGAHPTTAMAVEALSEQV